MFTCMSLLSPGPLWVPAQNGITNISVPHPPGGAVDQHKTSFPGGSPERPLPLLVHWGLPRTLNSMSSGKRGTPIPTADLLCLTSRFWDACGFVGNTYTEWPHDEDL